MPPRTQWKEEDYDDMPNLLYSSDDEAPPARARQPQPSTQRAPPPRPPPATARPAPPRAAPAPQPEASYEPHKSRVPYEERMDTWHELVRDLRRFWVYLVLTYVGLLALDRAIKYPIQFLRAALVLVESLTHWLIWALEYVAYVPFVGMIMWTLAGAGIWSWINGGEDFWVVNFAGRAWRKLVLFQGSCLALIRFALPEKFRIIPYTILAIFALKRADRAMLGRRGFFSGSVWRWLTTPYRAALRWFDDFNREADEEDFLRKQGWTQDQITTTRSARAKLRRSEVAKRDAADEEDRRRVDAASRKMAEEENRRAAGTAAPAPAKPKAKKKKKKPAAGA